EILVPLIGGGDSSSTSAATISDVGIPTSSAQAVPEPSTFFVAGLGILGWLGYALRPRAPAQGTSDPGAGSNGFRPSVRGSRDGPPAWAECIQFVRGVVRGEVE